MFVPQLFGFRAYVLQHVLPCVCVPVCKCDLKVYM